jgi:hypothetical protein
MMRALFLALPLLCFGCDDPEAAVRAASVLEHGAANAQLRCDQPVNKTGCGPFPVLLECTILQDGSTLLFNNYMLPASRFSARSEAGGAGCDVTRYDPDFLATFAVAIDGGEVTFTTDYTGCGPVSPTVLDIETDCTGFNLEAFGVSP